MKNEKRHEKDKNFKHGAKVLETPKTAKFQNDMRIILQVSKKSSMLENESSLAKIGCDTAENGPH